MKKMQILSALLFMMATKIHCSSQAAEIHFLNALKLVDQFGEELKADTKAKIDAIVKATQDAKSAMPAKIMNKAENAADKIKEDAPAVEKTAENIKESAQAAISTPAKKAEQLAEEKKSKIAEDAKKAEELKLQLEAEKKAAAEAAQQAAAQETAAQMNNLGMQYNATKSKIKADLDAMRNPKTSDKKQSAAQEQQDQDAPSFDATAQDSSVVATADTQEEAKAKEAVQDKQDEQNLVEINTAIENLQKVEQKTSFGVKYNINTGNNNQNKQAFKVALQSYLNKHGIYGEFAEAGLASQALKFANLSTGKKAAIRDKNNSENPIQSRDALVAALNKIMPLLEDNEVNNDDEIKNPFMISMTGKNNMSLHDVVKYLQA